MFDPKSSETIGYHLFYLPSGELFEEVSHIIRALAKSGEGPVFEPHVTLLARIPKADEPEVIAKAQQLARRISPFQIVPEEVRMEDAFFRAMYCKVNDDAQLQKYHREALGIFGMEEPAPYIPHLSLFYGNADTATKEKLLSAVKLPQSMSFVADRLYLYQTEGEAKNWKRIGEYAFASNR